MGWKKLKEHFNITHIVQVGNGFIYIGSPYVHDIVKIEITTGQIVKNKIFPDFLSENYPVLLETDNSDILKLIHEQDVFDESITVYTYKGSDILERQCEKLEWPNVTHEGELMYENTFSTDKAEVVRWAKQETDTAIRMYSSYITDVEDKLNELKTSLAEAEFNRNKLYSDYPEEEE